MPLYEEKIYSFKFIILLIESQVLGHFQYQ